MEVYWKALSSAFIFGLLLVFQPLAGQEGEQFITFNIKNAGINVQGTFHEFQVEANYDPHDPKAADFKVSIDVNSLDTGIKGRDKHLKKEKYFDLENYPQITFNSTGVSHTDQGYILKGNLTIKATTLPVEMPFTVTPDGNKLLFKGEFTLDRRDYEVGRNHLIMGDEVRVEIRYLY